ADIKERQSHVRFTPESRHSSAPVACRLSAKSGHTWGPISTLQWSERNGRQDAQEVGEGRKEGHRQAPVAKKAIKSRKTAPKLQRIKERGDWRGETLARLRGLIQEADPEVVEEVKWRKPSNSMLGVPVWSHAGIICTGETYKAVVKLTFA